MSLDWLREKTRVPLNFVYGVFMQTLNRIRLWELLLGGKRDHSEKKVHSRPQLYFSLAFNSQISGESHRHFYESA